MSSVLVASQRRPRRRPRQQLVGRRVSWASVGAVSSLVLPLLLFCTAAADLADAADAADTVDVPKSAVAAEDAKDAAEVLDAAGASTASPASAASAVEPSGTHRQLRWLWWPAILYLFWAMAHVCDVYFVRAVDVIAERFAIPEDVAGATLMALGCNGPEMALNTIAIFHPSEIGVGAVIGGEVFNVLVIIGTALLATPAAYMPLKLGCFSFFRDVLFYVVSVALLYLVLRDGEVTRIDALVLLSGAAAYALAVACSDRLRKRLAGCWRAGRKRTRQVSPARPSPSRSLRSIASSVACSVFGDSESESEEEEGPDPESCLRWQQAYHSTRPALGSVLGVRADVRNRLMDRGHHFEDRYIRLRADALLVSTARDPREVGKHLGRSASGIVYDKDERGRPNRWHHGGLINQPSKISSDTPAMGVHDAAWPHLGLLTSPLMGRQTSEDNQEIESLREVSSGPWEAIPLDDILYCERRRSLHFSLHVYQHASELGNLITLELTSKDDAVVDAWVEAIKQNLIEMRRHTAAARGAGPPTTKSCLSLVMEWVEWLQFPVKFWLARTIPDMDNEERQHLFPVSFAMSMAWLAVFAYSVVAACDGIHRDFGISTKLLGFTVAAAGTSFPNVISGIVVARQGKTPMAVANALGANVQNVFLALALPWTFQTCVFKDGPFALRVGNLGQAIVACYASMLVVVLVFLCCSCSMPRWSGFLFLVTYVVYVVFAVGQETFG